jgi:arylformamidase
MTSSTPPLFDPAWLDSQYNNRALVPEHGRHFAQWAAASAQVRQQPGARLDVPYGADASEMLDIFPAVSGSSAAPAPVLVFLHGGYWRSLDKSDHAFLAPAFTAQGVCVVVPNYALCPALTIPQITLQMVQALAWVYRHIGAYGGDPQRITVVGHSAGGHLAAMMLLCQWSTVGSDLPATLVKNALSISGLYDLELVRHTPFLQNALRLTPDQVRRASPALLPAPVVHQGRGTLCSVVGGDESGEFLRHNRLIQARWGQQVVPVCEDLPGLHHFSVLEALAEPGHRLHQLANRLLA